LYGASLKKSKTDVDTNLSQSGAHNQHATATMGPRTRGKQEPKREADKGKPSAADVQDESPFAQLAREHWLKPSKKAVKVKPDLIKSEIWDVLQQDNFAFKSLLSLENLQILEKYVSWISPHTLC
jgi:hypothetical protein